MAYAKTIAGNAPLTVKAAKAAINAWEREAEGRGRCGRTMVDACFNSEDYREGAKLLLLNGSLSSRTGNKGNRPSATI